jgi:hypothetical protein
MPLHRSLALIAGAFALAHCSGNIGAAGESDTDLPGNQLKSQSAVDGGLGTQNTGTGDDASTSTSDPATGIAITLNPSVVHLAPSAAVQLSATVTGTKNTAVTWTVTEASGGTIGSSGNYTAPAAPGTYHVVATSVADAVAKATVAVFVNTVGNCSNLPAAGQWDSIAPVTAKMGDTSGQNFSEAVIVDPFDPATVWLGTGFAGVFKSTDCGATWKHVNTGRNGAQLDNGSHVSMAIDPVAQGTMYAVSLFGAWGLWKSTNGGVDWDQLFPSGGQVDTVTSNFFDSISMDPTDHTHLVVGMHGNCTGAYAPTCEAETKDAGMTWRLLKTPNANWEEGAGPWILSANSWLYAGEDLWLTVDSGNTWKKITPTGTWSFSGGEVETHSIPRGPDGTYFLTSSQGITRSSDGQTWTLIPNFAKSTVGFATGGGELFASDQWSTGYYTASGTSSSAWTTLAPPPSLPSGTGAPFIDYDSSHHVLYSSNFDGGLWRVVRP